MMIIVVGVNPINVDVETYDIETQHKDPMAIKFIQNKVYPLLRDLMNEFVECSFVSVVEA